ncbi:uncharacterized protein FMAN_02292 [Fusarium mangiferae]|uniref:Uncharacterized protein n=1 Tax=Fusarium mangiferae TaxID=192010 RepID=A0A1L7TRK2_FUSMA|nr:uncharacterized protein FMAN_02292 [Fusarium mangiferae]CVK99452.1 uncharacterized protein FMAN_02292 [Fusarium mangiferae]
MAESEPKSPPPSQTSTTEPTDKNPKPLSKKASKELEKQRERKRQENVNPNKVYTIDDLETWLANSDEWTDQDTLMALHKMAKALRKSATEIDLVW